MPNPFPNEAEAALLALQPGDLVATDACERWEEPYEGAVAMIICPGPEPANEDQPTFFALYDDVAALTSDYDGIMANSEVPDETDSACQDLEASNHGWSYLNNGGNPGRQQGWLGCFARTDTGEAMVQYAWTHEELLVLGLWQAPDYGTGLDYFDAWASAVQP